MTQKLRVVLVALVVSLLSQASFAQYAANNQLLTDTEQSASLRDGQRLTNVGKTIMLSGASIAMMGLTAGTVSTIAGVSGDDIDVFLLYTAIGGYFGGMVALTGLPFYLSGKAKMKKNGSSLMTISCEGQSGYVTHVEAGFGLANTLSLNAVRGYNFNEHLFVGGGVGCSGYLFTEPDEAYLEGTFRCFSEEHRHTVWHIIEAAAQSVDAKFGTSTEVDINHGYPAVVSDDKLVDKAIALANDKGLTIKMLEKRYTSEDFGFYCAKYPSLFYRLGVGTEAGHSHTSTFAPSEEAIEVGIDFMEKLAKSL